MSPFSWMHKLSARWFPGTRAERRVWKRLRIRPVRLQVELLEERVTPTTIVVTPVASPTPTNNDYTVINNAIQAAQAGDTVDLEGTFNWTETNAAASWALGSDGMAGTADDYGILVQPNVNNVTVTSSTVGGATIEGPGDLPAAPLSGFLAFQTTAPGDANQDWTISNLRIVNFDLGIGMFVAPGGPADSYFGTTITNNYILVATPVATDAYQSIGIAYSYGKNQTISDNTIEFGGDGVSDSPSAFATTVGLQSETGSNDAYDGLQITGNIFNVLHAQSSDPEVILGSWDNSFVNGSTMLFSGNQFNNLAGGNDPTLNRQTAFLISSQSGASTTVTYSSNTVSGANIGFDWTAGADFSGDDAVILTGNTISGNDIGIRVQSNGSAALSGDQIDGNGTGVLFTDGGSGSVAGSNIYANGTGVLFTDAGSGSVDSNDFTPPSLGSDNGTDVRLDSTAGTVTISATAGNTFGGTTYFIDNRSAQDLTIVNNTTPNVFGVDNFGVRSHMFDKIDDPSSGLVTWVTHTIFVTPLATPTATDNDYTRVNNAVQAAQAGWTVNLKGTFDWTETHAAASWALGSDGMAGTADDYGILVPVNLNDVTLTSPSLGDATIEGPGDLPAAPLSGFLAFQTTGPGEANQDWTISNLRIVNFDLGIGMFVAPGGPADSYLGTTITNNYILVATPVATDAFQSIGIAYSYGKNQTISDNTIEFGGDGVSDSPDSAFATTVGLQSETSGGDVYDGLQITGNIFNVLHAQSSDAEVILGSWDNSFANSSTMLFSSNQFNNLAGGNNPTLNRQTAFLISSHSSASTTVTYSGNTIGGANIGFDWTAGADFSGDDAVILTGNTITSDAIAIRVQSNGSAQLGSNTYTGPTLIDDGTVHVVANNALGAVGAGNETTVAAGSTLDFSGVVYTALEHILLAGGLIEDANPTQSSRFAGAITLEALTNFFSAVANDTLNLTGVIGQSAAGDGLTKEGAGTVILSGAETYTGLTDVLAGLLAVNGSLLDDVLVEAGGAVGGSGTIGGSVSTGSGGGTVSPGLGSGSAFASSGVLTVDTNVTFTNGSSDTFQVDLNGAAPGNGGYDQLVVGGDVNLNGATLALHAATTYAIGTQLEIIDNEGNDDVQGTFAGHAEGSFVTATGTGQTFQISYVGGDGNDVILTAAHLATATTTVNAATTTVAGQSTLFQVTVMGAGATPTGLVTLFVDGSVVASGPLSPVASGQGSVTFADSSLSLGDHSVVAIYNGDANYGSSTSLAKIITVVAPSISDNFDQPDSPSSLGSNWAVDPNPFSSPAQDVFGISSNQAVTGPLGNKQGIAIVNGFNQADGTASVTVTLAAGAPIFDGGGVVLRADNADNAYVGMVLSDGAGGAFAALGIYRSGSLSLAALTSVTTAASYTVQLSVVGTQLTLMVDSGAGLALVGSVSDATLNQPGGAGMIDIGGASTFDNFKVSKGLSLTDTFQRAPGGVPANNLAPGWSSDVGTPTAGFGIDGTNHATPNSNSLVVSSLLGINSSTIDAQATITSLGAGSAGLVVNWDSANKNGYEVVLTATGVAIIQINNGAAGSTLTAPTYASLGVSLQATNTLEVQTNGATLSVFLNGKFLFTFTDPGNTYTTGTVGLAATGGGAAFSSFSAFLP